MSGENEKALSDWRIRTYDRQAAALVAHLRSLADEVERAVKPRDTPGITGTARFTAAAESANHALTWGLANAGAYRLFDTAWHADDAEREFTAAPAQPVPGDPS